MNLSPIHTRRGWAKQSHLVCHSNSLYKIGEPNRIRARSTIDDVEHQMGLHVRQRVLALLIFVEPSGFCEKAVAESYGIPELGAIGQAAVVILERGKSGVKNHAESWSSRRKVQVER